MRTVRRPTLTVTFAASLRRKVSRPRRTRSFVMRGAIRSLAGRCAGAPVAGTGAVPTPVAPSVPGPGALLVAEVPAVPATGGAASPVVPEPEPAGGAGSTTGAGVTSTEKVS